ncbi:hypothetical protein BDV93DRAFT_357298 [Ceratobasidium sp. AG-I]|nr:hypothetical protein BDV93DRAFT_357298 [Ceratobasidium sp. AG-I]
MVAAAAVKKISKPSTSLLKPHLAPLIGAYSTSGQIKKYSTRLGWFCPHNILLIPTTTPLLVCPQRIYRHTRRGLFDPRVLHTLRRRLGDKRDSQNRRKPLRSLRWNHYIKGLPELECIPATYNILLAGFPGAHASSSAIVSSPTCSPVPSNPHSKPASGYSSLTSHKRTTSLRL